MKLSLRGKTIILIIFIGLLISAFAMIVFYNGLHDAIISQYSNHSIDIANLAAVQVDTEKVENIQRAVVEIYENSETKVFSDMWGTPEFDEYLSQFAHIEEMEDFQDVLAQLKKMQNVINVDCLYITWYDMPNKAYIYLVDAANEDPCPPGVLDHIYNENIAGVTDPEIGFEPNITNTPEYGWLIATGMPIRNAKGEIIATAAVDISMNEVMKEQNRFLTMTAAGLLGLTIFVSFIGIMLVNRFIVSPVNKLSDAAEKYTTNKQGFSNLNIRTGGDEIEKLSDSMIKMEQDINGYIDSLITTQKHADMMEEAANVDALTKVRNKRAYDVKMIQLDQENTPYGIAVVDLNDLKRFNDTYGHDKGDRAIQSLCHLICKVFKHSPVFRIGGDEFVVILEGEDFEEREQLFEKLNEEMERTKENESLPPCERVSAAIGFSVRDPEKNETAEDVFKRADENMYSNKKAGKHRQ